MKTWQRLRRPPWRTILPGCCLLLSLCLAYLLWTPGLDIRDGRNDRGSNGIWVSHGWLAGDDWFIRNGKTNEFLRYRDPERIRELAIKLRRHRITDVFPHLCPTAPDGKLPSIDHAQVDRFLEAFDGFRVMPWIGGASGSNVRLGNSQWQSVFTNQVRILLLAFPRLAGVQLNVEPLPSGDTNFLRLLEDLRAALPPGKLLSVASYPPPTRWHPYDDVHWDQFYFREVARHCDQMAVMMYDAAQRIPKTYQCLMADWTRKVLSWSEGKSVLLGVPTYDDAGVGYHDPRVENITNALLGVHRGLSRQPMPASYQGVSIYCDWETSPEEWSYFREHFLNPNGSIR